MKSELNSTLPSHKRFSNLEGRIFGQLRVLSFLGTQTKSYGKVFWWVCACSCGKIKNVRSSHLLKRAVVSCGCWKKTIAKTFLTKHGASGSRPTAEYSIWSSLLSRTTCHTNNKYADYGGRGIGVCDRWKKSFENFIQDMGCRPSPNYSIDRIDNSKGYSPENCRWATKMQQARNRRTNVMLTFRGETKCIAEWSDITGIARAVLYSRIYQLGWSSERALTAPVQFNHPKHEKP